MAVVYLNRLLHSFGSLLDHWPEDGVSEGLGEVHVEAALAQPGAECSDRPDRHEERPASSAGPCLLGGSWCASGHMVAQVSSEVCSTNSVIGPLKSNLKFTR